MNSYDLSRKFVDFGFENPSKIKPNHYALYFFAIEHCNRLGWKNEFGLPTTMTMEAIGIKSYNTYIKTFNELIHFGFFKLIERSRNQYSANIIALSNFNKALDKALDKAFIKHGTKQSESTEQSIDSIIKQINNKQYNNKQLTNLKTFLDVFLIPSDGDETNKIVFSKEVNDCYDSIFKLFNEKDLPKNEKEKNKWLDTIEKCNRLDKYSFEDIIKITKKAKNDNFWAKQFLTINKLRSKNGEKIKYIRVFEEINDGKQGKQTIGTQVSEKKSTKDFGFPGN